MPVVSLAQMLESGLHFGHQARRWNPKMSPYIFTERNGVHIIDLVQTAQLMDEAFDYIRSASASGKRFLFVGTKRQAAGIVAQEAARCGSYYINQRWLGGMLTNWTTIKTRIERLKDLERRYESGIFDLLPKQEASSLRRELDKLQKYLGGIKLMHKIPDVVVIVDIRREYNAVQECQKLGLPIVSLLDTNCDPDWVDIPIPGNDDAIRAIKLVIGKLADAIYEGRHSQGGADPAALELEIAAAEADVESDVEDGYADDISAEEDAYDMADIPDAEAVEDVVPDAEAAEDVVPVAEAAEDVVPDAEAAEDVVPVASAAEDIAAEADDAAETVKVVEDPVSESSDATADNGDHA